MKPFLEYFRCPEECAPFVVPPSIQKDEGYFKFGSDTICFGRASEVLCSKDPHQDLEDVAPNIRIGGSLCRLPFDPAKVVDDVRNERYVNGYHKSVTTPGFRRSARRVYSYLRPFVPLSVRRHLQRAHVRGWKEIGFPDWPVDCTVDKIFEKLLMLSLRTLQFQAIPFIWFWPEGYSSCAIMTHDVETAVGRDFCSQLMTIDDLHGIKSAFQIVPEERYQVSAAFLAEIRNRGFEINVHDLNHDGNLFDDREQYLRRVARINEYGRQFEASGFRSGVLYRKPEWYEALEFSYDMSIPNVAHLEAQRGGCCTVMPFFIGKILELPLTTTQDYALFHLLGDYSLELWMRQIRMITQRHGLVSCIAHPDYLMEKRARRSYESLLDFMVYIRSAENLWLTLPSEVNRWWRQRAAMQLVRQGGTWHIEGPGKENARIAWATLDGDRLVYSLDNQPSNSVPTKARSGTAV